ncbi:hypothetical protein L226DRAFT_134524 [Lentinus tigrinus ALCF2SS1-7]|uniref:Uncharacterized protein n=1 Tax=Lentinus tigrinus ALCF2SS1-6 TaxID=1328759 RepID=A0A5C2T6I5_9APHY|nr:hypothetical protein L227DRAFT_22350 [Lentinus tigrinus ALCF2SS1-6]RPD81307.1 hypothetical protein L226DRAFT_134524 [Lentinus tigrinus ALCF2SS1-7]
MLGLVNRTYTALKMDTCVTSYPFVGDLSRWVRRHRVSEQLGRGGGADFDRCHFDATLASERRLQARLGPRAQDYAKMWTTSLRCNVALQRGKLTHPLNSSAHDRILYAIPTRDYNLSGMMMESLAPELLHEICALACTDGSFIGGTLSLVCKRIRATTRAAGFHSVAISIYGTSERLTGFHSCFDRPEECTTYKPIVRHLFFAAAEGGETRGEWCADGFHVARHVDPVKAARKAGVKKENKQYREDLATLLRLVSQHLHTLSFAHCNGLYYTNLPRVIV